MKIYEVVFTDTRARDGDRDATFLVRAPDFRAAIHEVMFNGGSREHCSLQPHTVFEVGEELRIRHNSPDQRILRGPYFECAFNFGWREWRLRDDETESRNV